MPKEMSPNSTPHLLWARPVSQIPLFLSLHSYTFLLPALHSFRLCHQYGYSASTLLPPISRLHPSIVSLIERHLIASYQHEVSANWTHKLSVQPPCSRCQYSASTREEELRRAICKCRHTFQRELEQEVTRVFVDKCGGDMWDPGDGGGKMTTGRFLRRFCGLELFVERSGGLWLCLPFEITGGGERRRLCVGGGYTVLTKGMVGRFRFAVETLGMVGEVGAGAEEAEEAEEGERRLVHCGGKADESVGDFGVKLMLFSAGFVVA